MNLRSGRGARGNGDGNGGGSSEDQFPPPPPPTSLLYAEVMAEVMAARPDSAHALEMLAQTIGTLLMDAGTFLGELGSTKNFLNYLILGQITRNKKKHITL